MCKNPSEDERFYSTFSRTAAKRKSGKYFTKNVQMADMDGPNTRRQSIIEFNTSMGLYIRHLVSVKLCEKYVNVLIEYKQKCQKNGSVERRLEAMLIPRLFWSNEVDFRSF